MAEAQTIDIPGLICQLIEDPGEMTPYDLGMLARVVACATEPPAMPSDNMDVVGAALEADGGA
jgi:hypothetical protein